MRTWGGSGLLALGLIAGGAAAQAAEAPACNLEKLVDLPIKATDNTLLMTAKLEGQDVPLLVDTGSPTSFLTAQTVDRLKLHPLTSTAGYMVDAAGKPMRHYVSVKEVNLNGMIAHDTPFFVMGEGGTGSTDIGGIFGADFLQSFDIELDIPHGKMGLFTHNHCSGRVVYWTEDYVAVPFILDASKHPIIDVTLDGESMQAFVDTGSGPTTISTQSARRRFGIDPQGDGEKPIDQLTTGSGETLPIYKHKFTDLKIGDVDFHNPVLMLVPDKMTAVVRQTTTRATPYPYLDIVTPITIGIHNLSKVRVFIAYSEHMLYISAADAK